MIVHECKQGSDEWFHARMGVPTSSKFDLLMTPKTRKPSASADKYLYELLAEDLIGEPRGYDEASSFMTRGNQLEQQAADWYALTRGEPVFKVGFCTTDDGLVGCSPDRLVGDAGLLEIKNPSAPSFVKYLIDGVGTDHYAQCQGQLLVTGRSWVDLLIFNPLAPRQIVVRHEVDPEWRSAFEPILGAFVDRLVEGREKLRSWSEEGEWEVEL